MVQISSMTAGSWGRADRVWGKRSHWKSDLPTRYIPFLVEKALEWEPTDKEANPALQRASGMTRPPSCTLQCQSQWWKIRRPRSCWRRGWGSQSGPKGCRRGVGALGPNAYGGAHWLSLQVPPRASPTWVKSRGNDPLLLCLPRKRKCKQELLGWSPHLSPQGLCAVCLGEKQEERVYNPFFF